MTYEDFKAQASEKSRKKSAHEELARAYAKIQELRAEVSRLAAELARGGGHE